MSTVNVKGLSELGNALKAFGPELGIKYLRRATSDAAHVIRVDAWSRVVKRTGALADAISTFKRRSDASSALYAIGVRKLRLSSKIKKVLRILAASGQAVSINSPSRYFRFVEFGTAHMSARPFLRPAFESKKLDAIETFRASLAIGVDKAAATVRAQA